MSAPGFSRAPISFRLNSSSYSYSKAALPARSALDLEYPGHAASLPSRVSVMNKMEVIKEEENEQYSVAYGLMTPPSSPTESEKNLGERCGEDTAYMEAPCESPLITTANNKDALFNTETTLIQILISDKAYSPLASATSYRPHLEYELFPGTFKARSTHEKSLEDSIFAAPLREEIKAWEMKMEW